MKTCAGCGAQNIDEAAFCTNCGYAFAPREEQPAPSPLSGAYPPPEGYPPQAPPVYGPPAGYPAQAPLPGYQQPLYVQPVAVKPNGKATASLITGIIGMLVFPIVFSVLAVVLGTAARNEIKASGGWQTGEGSAIAGIVLGIIGLVGWVIALIIIYA